MTLEEIQLELARMAVKVDGIRGGLMAMREHLEEYVREDLPEDDRVDQLGGYLHGLVGILAVEEAEPLRDSLKAAARITQADLDAEMQGTADGTDPA